MNLAFATNDRQMLDRCVWHAGRLKGGVSSHPSFANAAQLRDYLDASFGGPKAALRARDLEQLNEAVKHVKKNGFAPFGWDVLANANKLVTILARKQAKASTETEGKANDDLEEASLAFEIEETLLRRSGGWAILAEAGGK